MTNRDFDNFMKKKLDGLQSETPPNWEKMSASIQKWKASESILSDKEFDHTIREKLEDASSVPTLMGWEKFKHFLHIRRGIHKQVVFYQISGAAILALLLMALFQMYPIRKADNVWMAQKVNQPKETKAILPVDTEEEKNIENSIPKALAENNEGSKSIELLENEKHPSSETNFSNSEISYHIPLNNAELTTSDDQVEALDLQESLALKESTDEKIQVKNKNAIDSYEIISTLPSARIISVRANQNPVKSINLLPIIVSPENQNKSWEIGAMLSTSTNHIYSPFDEIKLEPGYERYTQDIGFGLRFEYRIKDFSLNSGLNYQSFNYEPRFAEEYVKEDESFVHLDKIGFTFLHLPLHLNYNFYNNGAFHLYALGGLTAGFLLDAQYDIAKRQNGLVSLINDLKTNPSYKDLVIAQKDYEEGIAAGGQTSNNLLLAADFGLGLEYEIATNITLFAEGIGHYNFINKAFGPNNDQINRLSFNSGIKVALN